MSKLLVFSYHAYRALQTGGAEGLADLLALKQVGNLLVGVPYQHTAEPYLEATRKHGLIVCWTVGAHERPRGMPLGWIAWDCEGGGDPKKNAVWWRGLASGQPSSAICYSGYPGVLYSGQTIQERYGCDVAEMHGCFSRGYGHGMPWPTIACGGVRGPLPTHALDGMPTACPVLHAIASPDLEADPDSEWLRVRDDVKDRLRWIRTRNNGRTDGLCLVQAVDGPAGARWGEADSTYCRIVGEEIAQYA